MKQITPKDLSAWLADASRAKPTLLDVREAWEYETCSIQGSRLIPMGEITRRVAELDPQAPVVVICHHGGRSMQVAGYLAQQGFSSVHNLTGGVDAWARNVDSAMPVY
jgi:rhodanese-related sulfurtransferase